MKIYTAIQSLIIILLLQSCTSSLNSTKSSNEGEVAYQAGNYEASLNYWEQIIESKGKRTKGPVYIGAANAAMALKQNDKAGKYLEAARSPKFSSPELYESLAKVYKNIDNLSKEITALETYREKYPQGKEINSITVRLFETYVESENWDLAIDLWSELESQAQTNVSLLAGYLTVNKNMQNTSICNKLARQIFKLDAKNLTALEYYAEKHFWKAENLYLKEMKAYKNKKTRSQYNKLLKALKLTGVDYNKSLNYYLKSYKIKPKAKYAKYLGNIYTRLDNKKKAAYYYKRAK